MTEPCLTSLEQQEAAWIASMDSSVGAFSIRAKRALFLQGVKTKNEALRIYCLFFTMPNCGRKTQIEIGEWIGLTAPEERDFARIMSQKLIDQYYKENPGPLAEIAERLLTDRALAPLPHRAARDVPERGD